MGVLDAVRKRTSRRKDSAKGESAEAAAEAAAQAEAAKSEGRVWLERQSDNEVVLGYETPAGAEDQGVMVTACVAALMERMNALDSARFHAQEGLFKKPQDPFENMRKQRADMDARRAIYEENRDAFGTSGSCVETIYAGSQLLAEDLGREVWLPFNQEQPPVVTAAGKRGNITLTCLPQNMRLELRVFFRSQLDPETGKYHFGRFHVVPVQTDKAAWVVELEQNGLSSICPTLQRNRILSFELMSRIVEDEERLRELNIDAGSAMKLSELLARKGFITEAERRRLAAERIDLHAHLDELLQTIGKDDPSAFVAGQMVRKGGRQGVVAKVLPKGHALVRWDGSEDAKRTRVSDLEKLTYTAFLSHAQAQSQDQVANLNMLLEKHGMRVWLDMDAEELTALDMCRGISLSEYFLIYLTDQYFERYFCRLESGYAREAGKPLLVVFESDPRHGGDADYVSLVARATHRYPEYREWLLSTEAIPMARRAFSRGPMVREIAKRCGIDVAGAAGGASSAESGASLSDGTVEAELRGQIRELQEELTKVWDVVDRLQALLPKP